MKKICLSIGLILVTVACSPRMTSSGSAQKKPEPTPASSEPVPDVIADAPPGQSLFENNCGKCHNLPSPTEYSKEKWGPIVKNMRIKARLTEEQGNQVYDYIASLAK